MDLQALQDCDLIEELEEKGANIEFKTYIYSLKTLQMESVTISCPVSGNYILTELARAVSGSIDSKDEKTILAQLFTSLEDNIKIKKLMKESPLSSTGLGVTIRKAIDHYLQEVETQKTLEQKEFLKFDFLRLCSGGFDEIYSSYIQENGD